MICIIIDQVFFLLLSAPRRTKQVCNMAAPDQPWPEWNVVATTEFNDEGIWTGVSQTPGASSSGQEQIAVSATPGASMMPAEVEMGRYAQTNEERLALLLQHFHDAGAVMVVPFTPNRWNRQVQMNVQMPQPPVPLQIGRGAALPPPTTPAWPRPIREPPRGNVPTQDQQQAIVPHTAPATNGQHPAPPPAPQAIVPYTARYCRRGGAVVRLPKAPPAVNRAQPAQGQIVRVDHVYEYRSTEMHRPSLLELHDYLGTRPNSIEFMSPGAIAGEHGWWRMRDDGQRLEVGFNYRWQEGHPGELTLHPTRLQRTQPPPGELADRWTGEDDKLAGIVLVHRRTQCKREDNQYPEDYPQGVL